MGIFQSVGGAATSGRGFTGQQVAEALKIAAEAQRKRHEERIEADGGGKTTGHRRTRSTVVQTLQDLTDESFTETAEYRARVSNPEASSPGDNQEPSSETVDLIVTEYAPEVFRYLRHLEGVLEPQFCKEWDIPEDRLKLELGEGRSMAMFLKSRSFEFMCKTISEVEVNVLLGILKNYAKHLSSNRHSLLMRFLMVLKVQVKEEIGYILCFADIFAGCNMLHERWDIKGRRPKPGKYRQFPQWAEEQTQRHVGTCTRRTASFDGAPVATGGDANPETKRLITRKDKDLTRLFWMEEQDREELLDQLQQDFAFLKCCGLMDYSVLIGVRYEADSCAQHCIPARSMRMTFALGEEGQRGIKEVRSREASPEANVAYRYDPNIITHNSKYHYGVNSMQGHETYYIGIIDMLTTYNWKKKTANYCKTFLWTEPTLSTIPPKMYEHRIEKYAQRIFASPESVKVIEKEDEGMK